MARHLAEFSCLTSTVLVPAPQRCWLSGLCSLGFPVSTGGSELLTSTAGLIMRASNTGSFVNPGLSVINTQKEGEKEEKPRKVWCLNVISTCVSVVNLLPISSKSTVCYLLCGNGLDPHITSHFWRARCWALSREDTGRTRGRKGSFLGLVLPFHFPQIHIPLSQAEAVRLQQVLCAGGS